MFKTKTLFIIGAGASCEVGLPSGNDLKDIISSNVDVRFDRWGNEQISGDWQITEALRQHVIDINDTRRDINPYLHAGWAIKSGMPLSLSIDNFLDAHSGNKEIELMGKLGIVRSILQAEANSRLFVSHGEKIDFFKIKDTWYVDFIKLLSESVQKKDLEHIFENVSFIVFNYDRCIEHFLVHALSSYYGISEIEAQNLVKKIIILHPYGVVGQLPWQINNPNGISFGQIERHGGLLPIANQIRTFTEQIEDETTLNAIKNEVQKAEVIVFLGFGYNSQNLQLITPSNISTAKRVFGTSKGLSGSDSEVVGADIKGLLQKAIPVHLLHGTCKELFNNFRLSLTRP